LQQRTKVNLLKIFNVLKQYGPMHIRGIAKYSKMHPITVSTLVSRFESFFLTEKLEVVPGFSAKVVRLKNPEVSLKDVEKYLEVKKQLKGIATP
jgi:hypothetical protein